MAIKRGTEIPTIDVELVTVQADGSDVEIALTTASQVEVEPQIEETDAVQLIVKGVLKAQKPKKSTLTSNEITLTDNVFTPELVEILQGGTIHYWTDEAQTAITDEPTLFGIAGYDPPVVGSEDQVPPFTLNMYTTQYNASGKIVQYERITYPNCTAAPVGFSSEDDTFRAPEYTITSMAESGKPPYEIRYMKKLPDIKGLDLPSAETLAF